MSDDKELEELIKLASSKPLPKQDKPDSMGEVHRFVISTGLKEGRHHIRADLLYMIYRKWSDKPIPKNAFFGHFSRYFESELIDNGIKKRKVYWLNKSYAEIADAYYAKK